MSGPELIELSSDDPVSTRAFLERVFGWEFDPANGSAGPTLDFETPDGTPGRVVPEASAAEPEEICRIRVSDLDVTMARAQEAGGALVLPRVDAAGLGCFFAVRIPGGPILTCWQSVPRSKPRTG